MEHRRVSVLIPCHNEEHTVAKVVRDFDRNLPGARIYVFDNNSSDATAARARESGAIVVPSARQGKGHVVRHMFTAIDSDLYVIVDGDDTYPADQVHRLLEAQRETGSDMVVGARFARLERGAFRRFHRFGNWLVAWLISFLFRTEVTDVMSGYRVLTRDFARSIPLVSRGFEIETEMTLQAVAKGFRITEVPVDYGKRSAKSISKLNTYSDGLLVLKTIATIIKDYKPLFFFSTLAAVFAILSGLAGWGPIEDYMRTGLVPRFPSAILAAALGLLSSISLGVGLILDTMTRLQRESFELWRRSLGREHGADRSAQEAEVRREDAPTG